MNSPLAYQASKNSIAEKFKEFSYLIEETRNVVAKPKLENFDSQITSIIQDFSEEVRNVVNINFGRVKNLKSHISSIQGLPPSLSVELVRLINLLSDAEKKIKNETAVKTQVASIIAKLTESLLKQVLKIKIPTNSDVKRNWIELNNEVELLWRHLELSAPENKETFIAAINWFSQQGKVETLDSLRQAKAEPLYQSDEIMFLIEQAQTDICKRECKDLLSFYSLKPKELTQTIEKMIQNNRENPFAPLPKLFAPKTVEKAITQLENTKEMIQKVYEDDKLENWLSTPNGNFLNKSPKDVVLKGKVFRILQYFIGLGEGIF